jgi:hypothetical protein
MLLHLPGPPTNTLRWNTGVAAWRAWLQKYGSAMPLLPKQLSDLPPLMSRRQALDRFEQHTKHCPDCQKVRGMGFLGRMRAETGGLLGGNCSQCSRCEQALRYARSTEIWQPASPDRF